MLEIFLFILTRETTVHFKA